MILNVCLTYFSYKDLNFKDERKIADLVLKYGNHLLSKYRHEVNIDFF